jgi:hypothetical protein
VNVTDVKPGDVAVIVYVAGALPVVNVTTAFPCGPVIVADGVNVPPVEVQDTGTFGTAFPYWSVDFTTSDVDADATTVCESTLTFASFVGAAANAVTVMLALTPVVEAVSTFGPAIVPSVHDTVAWPFASVVALDDATVPLFVAGVNVTVWFGTPAVTVEFITRTPIATVFPTPAD